MNGTKILLSLSLALSSLLAYQMSVDMYVEGITYDIDNYQRYAYVVALAVVCGVASIVALLVSINFIERLLTEGYTPKEKCQCSEFEFESCFAENCKAKIIPQAPERKSLLDDDTW